MRKLDAKLSNHLSHPALVRHFQNVVLLLGWIQAIDVVLDVLSRIRWDFDRPDLGVLWCWAEPGFAVFHLPVNWFEDLALIASNPIGLTYVN